MIGVLFRGRLSSPFAAAKEWGCYASIENTYQEKVLAMAEAEGLTGGEWVVTEKIHGSNFCFTTDGKEIKCAKRNALIEDDKSFFGHKEILKRLTPAILKVSTQLFTTSCILTLLYRLTR